MKRDKQLDNWDLLKDNWDLLKETCNVFTFQRLSHISIVAKSSDSKKKAS